MSPACGCLPAWFSPSLPLCPRLVYTGLLPSKVKADAVVQPHLWPYPLPASCAAPFPDPSCEFCLLINQGPAQIPFSQNAVSEPCGHFPTGLCFPHLSIRAVHLSCLVPTSFLVLDEKLLEIKSCVLVHCGLSWLLAQGVLCVWETFAGGLCLKYSREADFGGLNVHRHKLTLVRL